MARSKILIKSASGKESVGENAIVQWRTLLIVRKKLNAVEAKIILLSTDFDVLTWVLLTVRVWAFEIYPGNM